MSKPRELGCFYLVDDSLGPIRYKRNVEYVISVEPLSWLPGKAYVHFEDVSNGYDTAGPIKIQHRKNGTAFVQFEGKRYDIDESDFRPQYLRKFLFIESAKNKQEA